MCSQALVEAVYELCSVDAGAHGLRDRWCALLDEPLLVALERGDDAKSFHKYGPGAARASSVSCLLAEEMFRAGDAALEAAAAAGGDASAAAAAAEAHVRVAHAETLSLLLAMLGAFQGPLGGGAHDDSGGARTAATCGPLGQCESEGAFAPPGPSRSWRAAHIVPMSASLEVAVYRCGDDTPQSALVTLYHNGAALDVPPCRGGGECRWSALKAFYRAQWQAAGLSACRLTPEWREHCGGVAPCEGRATLP